MKIFISILVLAAIGFGFYVIYNKDLTNKVAGKCGFTITSVLPNQVVSWPLVIRGEIENSASKDVCVWQTSEGVAGTAQLYMYLTEEDKDRKIKGWKSIGDLKIINTVDSGSKKTFEFNFNFPDGGFEPNTQMNIKFTEENPAAARPSLVFELPLIFK